MTHDELLARISSTMPKDNSDVYVEDVVTALRAVVELHKTDESGYCEICPDFEYPCQTIQAIEKELK